MMRTLKSGLTIGMMVAALALTAGCGDNDNNNNGNDNGGVNPTRTPTGVARTATPTPGQVNPTVTPTPGGGTQNQTVTFTFANSTGLGGFQIDTAYPTAKGSFAGSGDQVSCTQGSGGGIFTKNDVDATGTLTLSVANTAVLTFPIDITCTFEATSAISTSDLTVTVKEVTLPSGAKSNIADLTVTVNVS